MKRLAAAAAWLKATNLPGIVCFGAVAMGVLCLLAGFHFPWFQIPTLADAVDKAHLQRVMIGLQPRCTRYWKLGFALSLAVAGTAAWKMPAKRRSICCLTFSAGAAILLFYPCSLLYLAPVEATRANWLQVQHRNLTWLGGDIFGSSEIKNQDWKFHVSIIDLPREVGAVKIPKSVPYLFDIGRLGELAAWLGYSDAYCYFVCKGWVLMVAGMLILLAATVRAGEQLSYIQLRFALKVFGGTSVVFCLGALVPVFCTGFAIGRAHRSIQIGDYATSGEWLDRAGMATPIIRENSFFIIQRGLIDDKLDRQTIQAEHFRGVRLENDGFYSEAETTFRDLLARAPANTAIQRGILRGLLRSAIRDLNSDQTGRGAALLETILRCDPVNIKANNCLQIAYLRTNRLAELQEKIDSMRQIYKFIGTITKTPVLAFCMENEALLRYLNGDLEGTLENKRKNP